MKKHGQDGQHQSLSDSGSPQKEKARQLHVPAQSESGKASSLNKIVAKKLYLNLPASELQWLDNVPYSAEESGSHNYPSRSTESACSIWAWILF